MIIPLISASNFREGVFLEGGSMIFSVCFLEPASLLKDHVERRGDQHHQRERERVPEEPLELRHVLEVHPVDCRHERRGEQDRRPSADLLTSSF